jgi:hypothetical protein
MTAHQKASKLGSVWQRRGFFGSELAAETTLYNRDYAASDPVTQKESLERILRSLAVPPCSYRVIRSERWVKT